MSRNKTQGNIKTLLFTPPFYWEFRINPLIYWFIPFIRLSFFPKKMAASSFFSEFLIIHSCFHQKARSHPNSPFDRDQEFTVPDLLSYSSTLSRYTSKEPTEKPLDKPETMSLNEEAEFDLLWQSSFRFKGKGSPWDPDTAPATVIGYEFQLMPLSFHKDGKAWNEDDPKVRKPPLNARNPSSGGRSG